MFSPRSFVAVVRSGCSAVHHSPPRFPPTIRHALRLLHCLRQNFLPGARGVPAISRPPYSLHATASARRHTQRKQAYLQSCAPYLLPSISIFYTLKKISLFLKKTCKKLARLKKTYYLCTRKIKTKYLTNSSLRSLYIYVYGKIKSPQPVAASCGRREG